MGIKNTKDYKYGQEAEREFAVLMSKNGEVIKTEDEVDMYDHGDFFVYIEGKKVLVDVKAIKKRNKWDKLPDDSINYLEEMNVNGDTGWINGKAIYISFQTNKKWIIVDRLALKEYIEIKCKDETIYDTKIINKRYRRIGRLDIMIQVETKELIKMAKLVLDRDKNYVDPIKELTSSLLKIRKEKRTAEN